jgi:hypothetical protein
MDRKPVSIENSLEEMNWQISYMEDIDKKKLPLTKNQLNYSLKDLKK